MFDITLGETRDFKFTTCEPDTGAPATLSGTPVISAYVDNSTTQITAGITLSVDFDGVTGLNNVRIVATSGNGYATGTSVALIITTGTVDGVSAVGYKVAEFTIGRAAAFTRLGAPAGASVSADIAAIEAQTDDIGAAGAGLTAIPWNAAWDAEVQSEVADALGVYDPPTNAEMEARTIASASYATAANLATVAGYLDTEIAAILADTNELQTDWADGGRLDLILDARASQTSVNTVDDFLDTEVAAILAAVDTEVAAIKAVTDLLPDAGALSSLATQASVNTIDDFLDTEVAAIKAKTDSLTFTTAGLVDANVQQINDVTITGNGQTGTEFGVA